MGAASRGPGRIGGRHSRRLCTACGSAAPEDGRRALRYHEEKGTRIVTTVPRSRWNSAARSKAPQASPPQGIDGQHCLPSARRSRRIRGNCQYRINHSPLLIRVPASCEYNGPGGPACHQPTSEHQPVALPFRAALGRAGSRDRPCSVRARQPARLWARSQRRASAAITPYRCRCAPRECRTAADWCARPRPLGATPLKVAVTPWVWAVEPTTLQDFQGLSAFGTPGAWQMR